MPPSDGDHGMPRGQVRVDDDDGVIEGEVVEAPIPEGYQRLGEAPRDGKAIVLLGNLPNGQVIEQKGIWRNYTRKFSFAENRFVDNSRWAKFNAGGQALDIAPIAWRHCRGFE